ncbi:MULTISPECIES: LysR family transcriptional regulator [Caloramator]|uniref:DNA-binding transcriptional regulator, LysR family n=1 Tax=Caloramator proteoclasticus DSM 10124 TaxID=1121262 RepID=A0A1M4XY00_9CLOT|nr:MULTISPECIES: LysR family transcriptional regulator [Caloramator]SHE98112.1 DNA-binding transcriptional regulator, LysR family [Caloramator proteoclasticus DSM 10124]
MNIQSLISFRETVRQNSISKASNKLHLTQSALSQQLQNLEKNIGCSLLIRSNKGVELTKEGEILLEYAESIISLYENMLSDINESLHNKISEIKILSCNIVGEYLLPCSVYIYKTKHSNIKFDIKIENTKKVIEGIQNKIADIGFIDKPFVSDEIESKKICANDLVFVYNPKKYKIPDNKINLSRLSEIPLVLLSKDNGIRYIIDTSIKEENIKIEMELNTIESIKASIVAGMGSSILPYTSVKSEVHAGILSAIPIEGMSCLCDIYLIYSKDILNKSYVKEFIEFILKHGKETFC